MKQILIIILALFLIMWYAGINHKVTVVDNNETVLTYDEVAVEIKQPDYNREYFSKNTVVYGKKRSLIPLVWKKDTLSASPISYWFRN